MSNHNNIKLAEGVYLRKTRVMNGPEKITYCLYCDSSVKLTRLSDYWKPKLNSTLDLSKTHFEKSSTIPRSKFREYGKNKNWNIVRSLDTASSIVIPDNYFELDYKYTYGLHFYISLNLAKDIINPDSQFRVYLRQNYSTYKEITDLLSDSATLSKIQSVIESSNSDIENMVQDIFLNVGYRLKPNIVMELDRLMSTTVFEIYPEPLGSIDSEKVQLFLNYLDKLVFDTSIASTIGDSVIGHAEFESIQAMIAGNDKGNITLAVSLLTQCNYSQSLLYLALFLFRYNYRVQNLPCYNLKDYQGLRAYFKDYGDVKSWNLATFANIVRNNTHLLDDYLRYTINNEMRNYVNDRIIGMDEYIQIDNVTFKYD